MLLLSLIPQAVAVPFMPQMSLLQPSDTPRVVFSVFG